MLTRASRPVAAVWHATDGDHVGVGFFLFELTGGDPILISRIDLVDEIDDDGILVGAPRRRRAARVGDRR